MIWKIENRKFQIGKKIVKVLKYFRDFFGSLTFNMLLLIPETGNCMPKACLRQFLYALYAFFRVSFGVKEATLTQTDGDVVVLLACSRNVRSSSVHLMPLRSYALELTQSLCTHWISFPGQHYRTSYVLVCCYFY